MQTGKNKSGSVMAVMSCKFLASSILMADISLT